MYDTVTLSFCNICVRYELLHFNYDTLEICRLLIKAFPATLCELRLTMRRKKKNEYINTLTLF